jgi:hypothetical protein
VRTDVSFDPARDVLTVHVHEVDGLSERKFGKPDLYVKLYLAPDPRKKTKVRVSHAQPRPPAPAHACVTVGYPAPS